MKILSTLFICTSNPKTAVCIRGLRLLDVNKTKVYLHENTLATREALFSEYLITTGFQAEPVLMFGQSTKERKELITAVKERAPEVDFFTTDHTGHRMWHISGVECAMIEDTFSEDDSFF